MNIDDLELTAAIYRVRKRLLHMDEELRSGNWVHERAIELCKMIAEECVTCRNTEYLKAFEKYGKQSLANRDTGERKSDIISQLYMNGFRNCFYAGRGLGECSDEIDLDRINPGSRGGEYTVGNCIIACSFHNRQRGDKTLEDYVNQGFDQEIGL